MVLHSLVTPYTIVLIILPKAHQSALYLRKKSLGDNSTSKSPGHDTIIPGSPPRRPKFYQDALAIG